MYQLCTVRSRVSLSYRARCNAHHHHHLRLVFFFSFPSSRSLFLFSFFLLFFSSFFCYFCFVSSLSYRAGCHTHAHHHLRALPPLPPTPALMIVGDRNMGKSTFGRFAINSLLRHYRRVAVCCSPPPLDLPTLLPTPSCHNYRNFVLRSLFFFSLLLYLCILYPCILCFYLSPEMTVIELG